VIGSCSQPVGPGSCPVDQYSVKTAVVNSPIPDNDPGNPLVTPPIQFDPKPGFLITDVVVDLKIEHTWVGDLVVTLKHTSSGGEVKTVDLLNRPGVPPNTFGCAGDLIPDSDYYFGTGAELTPIGEGDCPTVVPPACYAVAPENAEGLEIFRSQPVDDGSWELLVTDNAVGDDGYLHGWSLYILSNAPVSVNEASWGSIKARYRD
jgi:subtilisin-like proprotein convertase family protein